MKKVNKTLMALAGLAMIATSCSNELTDAVQNSSNSNAGTQPMTFTASQEESGSQSRTVISSTDATKINWQSDDKVAIFDDKMTEATSTPNEFAVTPNDPATTATLAGTVSDGATAYVAVYPKTAAATSAAYSAEAVTVTIPATQIATAGSFDPKAAVMTATSTGSNFAFKNVCSFLKIVTDKEYAKVEVSASTNIAGTFSVAPSTGVISSTTTGAQTISLTASSGNMAAGTYYVAIAPGSHQITIKCYTDVTSGSEVYIGKTASQARTCARTTVYAMGGPGTWTTGFASVLSTAGVTGNQVDWVQLWSGGPRFATMNVGQTVAFSNSSTAYTTANVGGLYMWGGTNNFNASSFPSADNDSGSANLTGDKDTATKLWGSAWRMITKDNFGDLISNCTWDEMDGSTKPYVSGCTLKGYKVSGKDGYASNSVFFPYVGCYNGGSNTTQTTNGNYWSSTYDSTNPSGLCIYSGYKFNYSNASTLGQSVRAVLK